MNTVTDGKDLLELNLRSDPRVLSDIRKSLCDWSLQRRWSSDEAAQIALAVDEALSNIIRHAYHCDSKNRILLSVQAVQAAEAEGVEIRLRDFGKPCDPGQIRGRALEDVRPGGLGVHIIRAMMDSVEYAPAPGGGTLLVMRKYKAPRASEDRRR